MRIIVDAMGGDNAPGEIVKGALRARKELGVDVVLVGRKEEIERCLNPDDICQFEIVDAREIVTMEDDPSTATRRKKDSSMTVALNLLRDGKGDAVVSAGSTGALLTGATLIVKRIRGIRRAAMAPVLPAGEHGVMLIDCGANVECTPEYLLQFGLMGSVYARRMMGCEEPRVGLLNVGTEDTKGGELQHQAFALLTGATLIVKRIKGIRRAAMAPVLPAGEHGIMLIDCGANVECTPEYLLQFAYMGSFYAKKMMGCESPRVGLLNVGTEDTKGGELQHQAFALLKQAAEEGRINFVGNVEGTGVFMGAADVVVTDGFTGNVLLKGTEGAINFMMGALKGVFYKSTKNKLAAAVLKNDLKAMKKSMDVNEVGGTAFVGISKPVIKAHGSSKEAAFFAAIRQAIAFVNAGVVEDIENNIEYMKLKAEN